VPVRECAAQPGAPADRQTAGAVRRRLSLGVMPAGQAASLFWYFQVSGTFESDSPQHVSCSHIGNNQRSGPIRVGRLRPASIVGSLGKRSLNILRSLPAPMIQLAAPIQVHSGGFVRRLFLSSVGGRRLRTWLRSNSPARCEQRRHNQALQPTCNPPLRSAPHAAELGRYAPQFSASLMSGFFSM